MYIIFKIVELFPYVHLGIVTFRGWEKNIGKWWIKDSLKGGGGEEGFFEKVGYIL